VENDQTNMTFAVPEGTWRQHVTWDVTDCPPWWQRIWNPCHTREDRWIKYELIDGPAVAHFGGALNDSL
jgi:hypothetical protein